MTLEMLPCGCKIGNDTLDGERRFLIQPCKNDCPNYVYAQRLAVARGKPIRYAAVDL